MNTFTKIIASASALLFAAVPLSAQETGAPDALSAVSPVKLSGDVMAVKTVTDAAGASRIELVEPDLIVPGDRLMFGTQYANDSADPVTNFTVTNPLPSAVRLAPDADPELMVSVDGAKTWGTLPQLSVESEDGSSRAATHADVTHVRWTIPAIAPGDGGRLEYPAIIR